MDILKQGNLRNCTKLRKRLLGNEQQGNLRNCTILRSPGKVDWWSLFARSWAIYSLYFSRSFTVRSRFVFGRFMACFTVRSRFVFGSSSALLARRVLVLFVFEMDFVLVWTLVLWYTGRRFRVHWTLIFQFVWALVSPLCLGALLSTTKTYRATLVESQFLGSWV